MINFDIRVLDVKRGKESDLVSLNLAGFDIGLTITDDSISTSGDTVELDAKIRDIYKKALAGTKLKIKKVALFDNNMNLSTIAFNLSKKEMSCEVDWFKVKEINQITMPFLDNYLTSNFLDPLKVREIVSLMGNRVDEKSLYVNISLIMIIEAMLVGRVLHLFLTLTQFSILDEYMTNQGKNIFSKYRAENAIIINNKNVKIVSSGSLSSNGKFLLDIKIENEGMVTYLTKDSMKTDIFSYANILPVMDSIYGKKHFAKVLKEKNKTSKENDKFISILNDKENSVIINDNFNNFYLNGMSYIFNENEFALEEVELFDKFLEEINKKIISLLKFE